MLPCFLLLFREWTLVDNYGCPMPLYFCPNVSSIFFLLVVFACLISAVADWMSTILPHMVWLCANLGCRSEMCCTWLAENTGCKQSPSRHHRTTLSAYIFAAKVRIDNWKKLVKQQYLLWPTSGWDRFGSLGHPCKFQRVSCLGSVTARHSSSGRQLNFAALNRGRHL